MKIHLFHAIGKFTKYRLKGARHIEDLAVYMIHEEFSCGDSKVARNVLDLRISEGGSERSDSIFVLKSLLGVLGYEVSEIASAFCWL
jgi:hypothetical protein